MRVSFAALHLQHVPKAVVAVDLGYSAKKRSGGVAWTGCPAPLHVQFGDCVTLVAERLRSMHRPVLVLEAVLSTLHLNSGNPSIRGDFETGRGWYWGPGAVSALAAQRFLSELAGRLPASILLAEAFLSNKDIRTPDGDDAHAIVLGFSKSKPVEMFPQAQPLLPCIDGVPSVRVFHPLNGSARSPHTLVQADVPKAARLLTQRHQI